MPRLSLSDGWRTAAVGFVVSWLLLWLWWGDVLWLTAENSYYGSGGAQMHFLWQQPYGALWTAGRALLVTCHVPALGAALLALVLTACAVLLRYTFRMRYATEWIAVTAFLVWMVHQGLDMFWQSEPGRLFGIPLLALALLAIESFILWTFRRRKSREATATTTAPLTWRDSAVRVAVLAASLSVPVVYASIMRPYVRTQCHVQRAMERGDWREMADAARAGANYTTRPLAAYHAIALVRLDEVLDHAFDLLYIYKDVDVRDRAGLSDQSHGYFVVDCDFHAGLLQASYHKAMEALTMEGPTVHLLKRMCQVAVMRGEKGVADKYLELLRRESFCSDFVEQWQAYNRDTTLLEADPMVQSIRQLEPIHDSMEGNYVQPTFLGYNIVLSEGRSPQALENSIAVCLYTKLMPAFMERARFMNPERLNTRSVALDALTMQASKVAGVEESVPAVRYRKARFSSFVQSMQAAGATGDTEARKPYAQQMLEQWQAYYPAYYFFGNLDATVRGAAKHYGYENAGVN